MVTLRDIARLCNVDISTVSKVIHGKEIRVAEATRQKIMEAAAAMDYRPNALARSLRTRRAGAIVMAVHGTTSYVYPEIIEGAQQRSEELGISFFLMRYAITGHPGQRLIALVREGRFDGMMFDEVPYAGFDEELLEANIPFVSLNAFSVTGPHYVGLDDRSGFSAQAEYLAGLGHKKIAFVSVYPESYTSVLCTQVFCTTLGEHCISVPEGNIFRCDFEGKEAGRVAREIVQLKNQPTAVACAGLAIAMRLVTALKENGLRVPEDVSVIGYHDTPIAEWHQPSVTTVRMPSRQQGAVAVERLNALLNGEDFQSEVISTPPVIIERMSTRAV